MPFPRHGHVFLSGPTPFICYPISENEVRLLIDFPGDQLPRKQLLQSHLDTNVTPYIPDCMIKSYQQAIQEGGFKVMPNHYMAAKPIIRKGAVMLGDALNMRHPLTGGGLTAVFSDIQILSEHLLAMPDFSNTELSHEKIEAYLFFTAVNTSFMKPDANTKSTNSGFVVFKISLLLPVHQGFPL